MLDFDKIITVYNNDYNKTKELIEKIGISELTAKILINRGIDSVEAIERFLYPDISKLYNPFLLKDMDIAVKRVIRAIEEKENIWIYGDYDVDGVTSTSLLKNFFESIGVSVDYYIPDRLTEGYGLNKNAFDFIHSNKGHLIITVDCGITSIAEVEYCNQLGMEIIITDHHQCGSELPKATAVVNPNRINCEYPFDKLAGVGVAFKFVQALANKLSVEIDYQELLPIVAIGTVADVVSLTDENRIIVKNGLKFIKKCNNCGIQSLIEITGLKEKEISSGHIGFVIGPRINAMGRIGLAKYAVELLTTHDKQEATKLAKMLDEENKKRQDIEREILKEAEEYIENNIDLDKERVLVIASEGWHPGVIGIVSSRITEKYHRPSVVITIEDGKGKGSARSISTFNIYDALCGCKELFINFGGHKQAAGLTLEREKIEDFRAKINEIANELLDEEDLIPEIVTDSIVNVEHLSVQTIKELEILEPFGIDNPKPQFLLKEAKVKNIRKVGNDNKHLKLKIEVDGVEIDCIGFNMGHYYDEIDVNDSIDIVGALEINDYFNENNVQIAINSIVELDNDNVNFIDKYYCSLKRILYNECDNEINVDNISTFLSNKTTSKDIVKQLENDYKTLIIVNNHLNVLKLLKILQTTGRELIKKTSVSFNLDNTDKTNNIVINPILNEINLDKYERIIFYDLGFTSSYYRYIEENNNDGMIYLFDNTDLEYNIEALEKIIPSVDILRIIYKTIINAKQKVFKIEIDKYIEFVKDKYSISINKFILRFSLDILKESNLIDYKLKSGFYYIKLNEKPNEKIDINNVYVYKSINEIKKLMVTIKDQYANL
ncbi:single-stranded-DNA-specific exonuclease RecJ [Caldisalinibacter kiritimatiensis]|uniref:Single-stranded-DNA-specific exonuclease RecJ n=1 Tax=Caldisalinibacter kiritimatiensis TaxID=1304284 RepID=R1CED7_9FIRM|nr:single-stranded-DNA-specific exonuclease RecJ [Caldisalinibacter kiritimatiensis]EOD00660.1 Single-stranded-DNA-specific exonuclease RecJ [Caldisalinibacter kiritimatiensis]